MRLHSLLGRLALPVVLVGLTAVGAATPAAAVPPPLPEAPEVKLVVPERVVATEGSTTAVKFDVVNSGSEAVDDLVVDFIGAVPATGFAPPEGCTGTSCPIGKLAPAESRSYTFTVKPSALLPELGAKLSLGLHDGDSAWTKWVAVTVLRVESGVNLEVADISNLALDPNTSKPLPVVIRNNGDKPVTDGFAVVVAGFSNYVSFPEAYENCFGDEELAGIICYFDQILAPGAAFSLEPTNQLRVYAEPSAPGPASYPVSVYVVALDETADQPATAARKAAAKLVPATRNAAASQPNEGDDEASFLVTVGLNPADSVAIGDNFTGAVGSTRTIEVGVRNDGPAAHPLTGTSDWFQTSRVRIPSGLKLTKVDQGCVPVADGEPLLDKPGQVSGHDYLCRDTRLTKGDKNLFTFTAKIENGQNEDEGSITVDGGVQDLKKANNVAKIKVKVSGSVADNDDDDGGTGGGLPITGAPAGTVAGLGVLLVAAGALMMMMTRRRVTS